MHGRPWHAGGWGAAGKGCEHILAVVQEGQDGVLDQGRSGGGGERPGLGGYVLTVRLMGLAMGKGSQG